MSKFDYEEEQAFQELRPEEIQVCNKVLRGIIEKDANVSDEVWNTTQLNLVTYLKNLEVLDYKGKFSEDMLNPMMETYNLISELLNYKIPQYVRNKLEVLERMLRNFLKAIHRYGKIYDVTPKIEYKPSKNKYPYPYDEWKKYYDKYGKERTYKKIYDYYLTWIPNNIDEASDRYFNTYETEIPQNEIEQLEKTSFGDSMLFYMSEGHKGQREFIKPIETEYHAVTELLDELDEKRRNRIQKVKNMTNKQVVEELKNKDRNIKEYIGRIADKIITEERRIRREGEI